MVRLSRIALANHFRNLALRMALHCVRNTIIEDSHAAGKLTDQEMAAFNREVADKIYSFLHIMFNPSYSSRRAAALEYLYAPQWDQPTLDKSFLLMLRRIAEKDGTGSEDSAP